MENVVVMYPSLGIGHLISMVELGELIISQDPTLTISILLTPQHYETKSTANYIKNVTSATPTITFHHLPTLPNPPDYSTPFFDLVFELIKSYNPIVHDTLLSISKNSNIKGVILDFLTNDAFEVCKSLDLPTYYLFTGSAFGVGMMLYMNTIHNMTSESFKDMRSYIEVPGTPPIYCLDMPVTLLDRNFNSYKNVMKIATNMTKAKGKFTLTISLLSPKLI